MPEDILQRFEAKIDRRGECWNWLAKVNWKGYGILKVNGKNTGAHRIAYELTKGKIPEGFIVHHLCHNRKCVRPEHLSLRTHYENTMAGNNFVALEARQTHCKRGHRFTLFTTYFRKDGSRNCKICSDERHARERAIKTRSRLR